MNGVDKSPHGRGYNFVVISERTGKITVQINSADKSILIQLLI